MSLGRSITSA